MSTNRNTSQLYVWEFAGDPTNVSTSIINPPLGALVVNSLTGDWHQKTTGYGDNSGYALILTATTSSAVVAYFSNVRIANSTKPYAASIAIDFLGTGFQTVALAGPLTFTSSNLAAGRSVTVRIFGDGNDETLTFPASWRFVGSAAPASIAANKTAILALTSFGTNDGNVYAAYATEP